eukprot:Blabericola_migrator_1__5052@NODE_2619_length_2529_cov_24_115353_g1641_i0_p3_GENE_NODE_2619_length_2529_cov_24_115353_g1641_i0NODE_2619_length_2529_cov_24_115353_g1641_i0_p3_ORF_typecomplete_len162_score30_71Myc_target_1/PF15179_6/0_021AAA_27/PF13514_6/0_091FAM76/PF16046_5/0_12HAUS6_N/PF14661_6/0_79_NODE_2619_length_2529_cov_24_115353_g1641_i013331818
MKWLSPSILLLVCAYPPKCRAEFVERSLLQVASRAVSDRREGSPLQPSETSMLEQVSVNDAAALQAVADPSIANANLQSTLSNAQAQGAQAAVSQIAPTLAQKEFQVAQKEAQVAQLATQLANTTNATAAASSAAFKFHWMSSDTLHLVVYATLFAGGVAL